MPQFVIRGIQPRLVQEASTEIIEALSALIKCPEDYITLDCLNAQSFFKGEQVLTSPIIDIGWFDRGQDMQDAVALLITNIFERHGVRDLEIGFVKFDKSAYYSNGVHY
jgi:hypothetical protein